MKSNGGPITHNGIHPITHQRPTIASEGKKGHEKAAPPKEGEKAAAGAKETGASGEHKPVGKQEKSMAEIMYPKKLGLRGRPDTTE